MRFVLFSDLHLDTAFTWAPPDAARRRRQALRDVLGRILALADEVDADAILSGGDLYEHERATPDTAAFLREALGSTSRPVLLAPGNHDWFGPDSLYRQVTWPSNVAVYDETRLRPRSLTDGMTVWGAAHLAPANTDGFLDDGFHADRGGVNLALFHGSERSGLAFEDTTKRPHAPFDAEQIAAAGLDHAFLGHHHRPVAAADHTYPGNPDPLTFGEDGMRGAVVASVAADGSVDREWRPVAVTEAHDLDVDVTGCASQQELRERVRSALAGRRGVARVTLNGDLCPDVDVRPQTDLSLAGLASDGIDALTVRIGAVGVAYDTDAIAAEGTVRGQFVRDVLDADLDEDDRRRVLVTGLRALEGRDDLEVV